jgi:hypothetical protein
MSGTTTTIRPGSICSLEPPRPRTAEAPDRRERVAGSRQLSGRQRARQRRRAERELLRIVDQHVLERLAGGWVILEQADRELHQIGLVAGAERADHAVVRLEDRGEFPLARAVLLLGPGRECRGIDPLGLEPVDPAHETAEQRPRISAEIVVLEGQLIDPLGQHRQTVPGTQRRIEQVMTAACAAQYRGGELRRRYRHQLGVAVAQLLLEHCAGSVGTGHRG